MNKTVYLVVILLLLSLVPLQVESDGPYTIWVYVTRDGQPQENASVTFTNLANDQVSPPWEQGDGWYGTDLQNINWDYGDTVLVEATYGAYSGFNSTILTHQGATYGDWLNITLLAETCPDQPTNPSPVNGATNQPLSCNLSVDVSDGNGDAVNVSFRNASNHAEIGTVTAVPSGGTASVIWNDLAFNTTYSWYAVADDGGCTNQSSTWQFTTRPPAYYTLDVSEHPRDTGSFLIHPDRDTYVEGTWVNITAVPADDYRFDHWEGDIDGASDTGNPLVVEMDKNRNIVGYFQPIQYTLQTTTDPSDGGSISRDPSGPSYDAGTPVQLTATSGSHYLFSHWSGDLTGDANPDSVTMNANKTVTAHFIENYPPNITIWSPSAGATVSGLVSIQGTASDANGDDTLQQVDIRIDQGNWTTAAGTTSWQYAWNTTTIPDGNHTIHARASDGSLSGSTSINVTVSNNRPPGLPLISGPARGQINVSHTFSATSTDPDNHSLRYGFDWDSDGDVDDWTGFMPSGETGALNHTWDREGRYSLQVRAEDEPGQQSTWSDPHSITITGPDTMPPNCTVELGSPNATLEYEGETFSTIKTCTPLWINATDGNGTGAAWLNVTVWWNETMPGTYARIDTINISDNGHNDSDARYGFISAELHFDEECFHQLHWDAVDYAGNHYPQHSLTMAVDGTAPTINKTIGEPHYVGLGAYGATNWTWVNCSTNITFHITDDGCGGGIGVSTFGMKVYWNETRVPQGNVQDFILIDTVVVEDNGSLDLDGEENGEILFNYSFSDDCFHEPEIWAVDNVGNTYTFQEKDMVDCTPPTSQVKDIAPFVQEAPFNVTVVDVADDASGQGAGVDTLALYYAYSEDNATFSDWRLYEVRNVSPDNRYDVPTWTVSFDPGEGHGYYRFASKAHDCLGNEEPLLEHDTGCYNNVSLSLTFGEPYHDGWISLSTPITISSSLSPPPAIYYRIYNNGSWAPSPGAGNGTNHSYYVYNGTFALATQGCTHGNGTIEFYGTKTGMDRASFTVDTRAPAIEQAGDMPFLVHENVSLEAICQDEGSGLASVELHADYSYDNASWEGGSQVASAASPPFSFPYAFPSGIGFYLFSFRAMDAVGNVGTWEAGMPVRFFSPDVNGDGRVNVLDMVRIGSYWRDPLSYDTHTYDINGDGSVNRPDLDVVSHFLT